MNTIEFQASGAIFSEDRLYRYSLWRSWGIDSNRVLWIMLNPSSANETKSDPTITRCIRYAHRWGFSGIFVANLFAHVSTDPKALGQVDDPVGPKNDETLMELHKASAMTIVAWGKQNDMVHQRAIKVANMLRKEKEIYALATCADGSPRHPLYLKQTLEPVLYGGYH